MDERTLQAWVGHSHLRIIGNETDFETKLRRTLLAVTHVLGIPEPLEIERKFLLAWPPDLAHPVLAQAQAIEIEQRYLLSEDETVRRVRKRSQRGHITYYFTEKAELRPGVREERERIIGPREYLRFLSEVDPTRKPIRKTRYCFAWENAYFELDRFHTPEGLWLAEEGESPQLPDFLSIAREVTEDPAFSNAQLARTLGD
jgi:CYTH domain-containing protein